MEHWTDRIVGDRMTVDQQFTDRVESSPFSRQQWGLVMTAIEFEIESPADDEAELVADTSALPSVIPELDSMDEHPMAGPGGPGGPGGRDAGGGVLGGIKDALGLGGDGGDDELDEERLATAERLADEYAAELQAHLEETGRWSTVRAAAAESDQ
ncbi:DUF5799 family protein [Halorientalis pallida]|uniref:DUF5799 family protein n=1 Tax=Halorientalis pallida TaxID=2479928 RepID=UPI003C704B98